ELSLLDQVVERSRGEDGEIEWLPLLDLDLQIRRGAEAHHQLVLRGVLELRHELLQHRFYAVGAHDLHFRCVRCGGHADRQSCQEHSHLGPSMRAFMNCSASPSVSRHTIHSWSPSMMRSST